MNESKLTPAAERLNSAPEGQPESYMAVALRLGPELEKAQANIDALLKENRELKAGLFGEHNLREEENAVHFGEMEELETQLAELQAQLATVNDPTFDATDAANPAWWRGHDYTAGKLKEKVAELHAQLTGATARADREAETRHRYERENERLRDAVETQEGVISQSTDERDSLRAALECCDVVMDTAAIHGVGDILPPAYRDSWAAAHINARKVLAADVNATPWRPIETAPRDGTLILLYPTKGDGHVATGYWHNWGSENLLPCSRECWAVIAGCWFEDGEVSHWMPIPDAPAEEKGKGE